MTTMGVFHTKSLHFYMNLHALPISTRAPAQASLVAAIRFAARKAAAWDTCTPAAPAPGATWRSDVSPARPAREPRRFSDTIESITTLPRTIR
jgi:hypothetical protein